MQNWVWGHSLNAAAAAGMRGYSQSSSTEPDSTAWLKNCFSHPFSPSPCCTKPNKACDPQAIAQALMASPSSLPECRVPGLPALFRGAGWSGPHCSKNSLIEMQLLMEVAPLTSVPADKVTQINALTQIPPCGEPSDTGHLHSLPQDSCPINVTTFVLYAGCFCQEAKKGGSLCPG